MSENDLTGMVGLVTGGGTGVGAAVAAALAELGVQVMATGRREDRLSAVARGLATPGGYIAADITSAETPDRVIDATIVKFGRLDIVVHAAGVFDKAPVEDTDAEFWHRIVDVNLTAVVALTRVAWPHLRQASGQVVLISSAAALRGFPGNAAYAATKGGLNAFGEVLRVEGQPHGIRMLTVCPAQIDTELWDDKAPDEVRAEMMRPDGVGQLIAALVASDRSIDYSPISIQPPADPWSFA